MVISRKTVVCEFHYISGLSCYLYAKEKPFFIKYFCNAFTKDISYARGTSDIISFLKQLGEKQFVNDAMYWLNT